MSYPFKCPKCDTPFYSESAMESHRSLCQQVAKIALPQIDPERVKEFSEKLKRQVELGGRKDDKEKPDLSLFSTIWLNGVGAVLTFGKKKYAAHNWRQGIQISRLVAAALRHLLAFNAGQDADPETGLSHLDHASCCLMFARELIETKRDAVDDRYKEKV